MSDDAGINFVRLGQVVHRLGKVTHLAGVDDDGRKTFGEQGADRGHLVRAGRLEENALGTQRLDPSDEFGNVVGGVGEASPCRGRADVDIEEILRDIDADDDALHA